MTHHLFTLLIFLANQVAFSQAPGVEIFDQSEKGLTKEEKKWNKQLHKLVSENKVLPREEAAALYQKPNPRPLSHLPERATEPLTPQKISQQANQQNFSVGWAEKCGHCPDWHFRYLGGAYAITNDGVLATCAHVIEPLGIEEVPDAVLIAIDGQDRVYPLTNIIACHAGMDAALVQIEAQTIPRSLSDNVRPGDQAFCHSRPLGQGDYFTSGIVNRFYWDHSPEGDNLYSLSNLSKLHLNVSCRWAPGSSGSPVFDQFGNVIGHVALIANLGEDVTSDEDDESNMTFIVLHSATPARAVMALVNSLPKAAEETSSAG